MNKRALVYARVSTDEQAERGYSLPSQIKECRLYAELHSLVVVDVITDDYSGMTLERPGFITLRSKLANGEASAVIVYTIDRLARDAVDFLSLRRQWERTGISLHFVDRGQSQGDFSGLLMDGIFALMAEGEAWKIRERTSNGRHKKAKAGKVVMSGHPPYGYRRVGQGHDACYVIDEREAQVVRDIFEWYILGNGTGRPMSLRKIARELEKRKIKPPSHKKKVAKFWYCNTVKGILANPIYTGITYYGKLKTVVLQDGSKKRIKRAKEEWTKIEVPELAFIDQELFNKVQIRAKRNKQMSKRNRKRRYLMTGHIRCGECGLAVIGSFRVDKGHEWLYYKCSRSYRNINKEVCSQMRRSVGIKKIDDAVWEWVVWLLSDDKNLEEGIKRLLEDRASKLEPTIERLEIVNELIAESDARIARLVEEMSNHEPGAVLDAIRSQIKAIQTQREALDVDRSQLEQQISQVEITESMLFEIKAMVATIRNRLPDATYETKRAIFDILDLKVILNMDEDKNLWLDVSCSIQPESSQIFPDHQDKGGRNGGLIVSRPSQKLLPARCRCSTGAPKKRNL